MPENGAYRIDIYYSTALNKYKVILRQYRTKNLLGDYSPYTEVISDFVVYKRSGTSSFYAKYPKSFKSKKRAVRYATKAHKKADKFLYGEFTEENWKPLFAYTQDSDEPKWRLEYDEAIRLEKTLDKEFIL